MALDVLDEVSERCLAGTEFPDGSLTASHQPGCTEPWVAQLVSALLVASGGTTVLETGGFMGTTSAWLALTLQRMGGGTLHVAEVLPPRAAAIEARLNGLALPNVDTYVHAQDVLSLIGSLEDGSLDFVWLDDDHQMPHVQSEVLALWPKMRKGGLIVGHDIDLPCDLQKVFKHFGGFAIHLPKLGPSGGIGIIQCGV